MKRTISLILTLALAFSAMLGIVSGAEDAATTGELSIPGASIEFGDTVYLYFAVDYSEFGDTPPDDVTLEVYNKVTEETKTLYRNESVEKTENFPANSIGFKLDNLGAKNMGDELTIQAYKGKNKSGKAKTFSVLEYAIKARELGNEKLTDLVNAMIVYGATAQSAFNHMENHADKDIYDLKKNYGLVVVSGSEEGKKIAEEGSSAPFTANTAKTGANAKIYDTALNAVGDSVIVPAGVSYYVYIGDAQRTVANLDMTKAAADTKNTINNASTTATAGTKKGAVYTTASVFGQKSAPKGTQGTDYVYWYMVANDAFAGTALVDIVPGTDGYIKCAATNPESIAFQMTKSAEFVKSLGEFTMSITVGKEGTAPMIASGYRLRGASTGAADLVYFLEISNSGNNSTLKMNGATLATIYGEEGVNKFVTIHYVMNTYTNTITVYVDGRSSPVTVWKRDGSDGKKSLATIISDSGHPIDCTFYKTSGTTLFQKFIFTKGNLFE